MRALRSSLLARLAAAFLAIAASPAVAAEAAYDLVIAGGRVIDGAGNPWIHADVGVRGDRIAAIGNLSNASAKQRIDAKGMVVAPGFIDMHSHASWSYLVDPRALSKLTQGVTLEIEGEGNSVAPMDAASAERERPVFERFGVKPDWGSLAQFFDRLERQPGAVNFATYIGTGTIREQVVGFDWRAATPAELERMRLMVREAMEQGALGVYSALMYSPDKYNSTDELIVMAKEAARYGGVYQTHPRYESAGIDESMDEVFRIAREAQIPAHITHLKVSHQQNWGRMPHVLRRIEAARAEGLDVTADMYPYEWAGGSLTALLPPWVQNGGRAAIVRQLNDKPTRERIKAELARPATDWENEYYGTGGGPEGILFIDAGGRDTLKRHEGKTLAAIAKDEAKDPREAMFDIILAGDGGVVVLITGEADIRAAMAKPYVAFGSDGSSVAPDVRCRKAAPTRDRTAPIRESSVTTYASLGY